MTTMNFLLFSIVGTYLGRHMIGRINSDTFYLVMTATLMVSSLLLLL